MQIKGNIFFIVFCVVFTMIFLSGRDSFGQEKADSLVLLRPGRLFADTLVPSPEPVPADTVATDSIAGDTLAPKPLFDDIITYTATDSVRFSIDIKKVFLFGKAKVQYLTTELEADYIELDMGLKQAFASGVPDSTGKQNGTPLFKDGGQEFESKELRYNFETGKGFVKDIITQEGEGYIQGRLTKKVSDSVYYVKNGFYTTCDLHDHPHYGIRMLKAKMIRNRKVVTEVAYLTIADVPLPIGIPFGFFPITTKGTSGVIMPTYGEERMRGFNLRNGGYYWAISDYIDLSLTGDIYTNGSWGGNLITNYRKRYKYNGNLNFTISKSHVSEKGLPDYHESSDWAIRLTHQQDPKADPYSTLSASVDMSSASNNYYNSTNINDISNQRKQSSISWSKKWPGKPFSLTAAFNHSQNSRDTTIALTFPNLTFQVNQFYPLRKKNKTSDLRWYDNISTSYRMAARNSINTKEYLLFKSSLGKDWQNGFQHAIPLSTSIKLTKDISLNPSLNYTGVLYLHSIEKSWVTDANLAAGGDVKKDTLRGLNYAHNYTGSVSLSYNPTVYGMFQFQPECKVYAIRHVIRPSVSVSYTPKMGVKREKYYKTYRNGAGNEVEYSIYEDGIFGTPSGTLKSSGNVSLSLDNNVEMKLRNDRDTTGTEEFRKVKLLESFRISTSYNITADSLNWSDIRLSARTRIFNEKVNIDVSGTLDPYAVNINGAKINRYHGGLGRLKSVSASTGFQFSSDKGKNREEKNDLVGGFYDRYIDFDVPWSINVDYNLSYSKSWSRDPAEGATKARTTSTISQMLRVNGNLSLTPKWQFGFSTGYDFDNKEITATSFNISRDLHCWDMTFSCIPFGAHQSYNFQINVRSSLLKDLKLTKRESWYDTGNFYQ